MKTSFLTVLAMLLFGTIASVTPANSRATASQDADYTSIEVPELAQAVKFFTDVLGCEPIGPRSDTSAAGSMLLACAPGSVVELVEARAGVRLAYRGSPVQLISDDPVATAHSLRQEGVRTLGRQRRLASGQTAVDLVAPWGLRLQLVSRGPDARIAAP